MSAANSSRYFKHDRRQDDLVCSGVDPTGISCPVDWCNGADRAASECGDHLGPFAAGMTHRSRVRKAQRRKA